MSRTAKISISIPDELLEDVERARRELPATRSDFFRRAAESLLRQEKERAAVARYMQGYVDNPETDDEEAWASLGEIRLSETPW